MYMIGFPANKHNMYVHVYPKLINIYVGKLNYFLYLRLNNKVETESKTTAYDNETIPSCY